MINGLFIASVGPFVTSFGYASWEVYVLCLSLGLTTSPIPPTFENENIHAPPLTIVDH